MSCTCSPQSSSAPNPYCKRSCIQSSTHCNVSPVLPLQGLSGCRLAGPVPLAPPGATPLCRPGRQAHAAMAAEADWEASKENYQPLKQGRKASGLRDVTGELRAKEVEERRR